MYAITISMTVHIYVANMYIYSIIGHVGSGKSSLLSALLGEMYRDEGICTLYGRVAYTSQQPWIRNETVRGKKYHVARFEMCHVTYYCYVPCCMLRTLCSMCHVSVSYIIPSPYR